MKVTRTVKELPSTLTKHDDNLILLKKNDNCTKHNQLLGPLGRSLSEDMEIKKNTLKKFMAEVEFIKEKNRKALISHKPFLNNCGYDYLEILKQRELERGEFATSKEIVCEESKQPIYIKRRVIRNIEQNKEKRLPNASTSPLARQLRLNMFVEAARRVLVHARLVKRLHVLKSLSNNELILFEAGHVNDNINSS